ncbi:MAG TPA: substrate-binding domain-containing protein, partial [Anaerolinea sp.]|nr:substrate-binding domain-containing protein [Anaerolinea sp.]
MTPPRPLAPRRRTIGYMANGIYSGGGKGGYHYSLWNGIREAALAHDVNLVCFIGGSYRISPAFDYEFHRNNVFDLVAAEQFDGIILGSAMLVSTLGLEGLARHYASLGRGPVVSISLELEDAPHLFIDNYTGARQIVDHLIEQHGYRRIAYLRGPEKNDEASVRYQAYLDSLRDHGLPFDPALVFLGDFNRPSGEAATQRLLDAFPAGVDALVAANDTMALGAISVLRSRGVLIPGHMAVVGFDDIPDAELSFPPLTTVRQPIYEMGQKAVELLLAHIDGRLAERQVALPTRLVVRNSCGCAGDLFTTTPAETPQPARTGRLSASRRSALLDRMVDALGCPPAQYSTAREQAGRLLDAVSQSLAPADTPPTGPDPIAQAASDLMEMRPVLPWHRAIPLLYDQRIGAPANPRWPHVWKLAGEIAWFSQSYERLLERAQEEQQSDLLRVISQALVITFDQAELMQTIARLFPRLGITGCWIFLSDQPGDLSQPVRLRLAYNRFGRVDLPPEGRLLPTRRLLPAGLLDLPSAFTGIVYSLFYGDTNFGFAVFEMDEPDQKTLEMLTSQINTALQGAR